MREAYLFGGNFSRVNLRGANLQRACLISANLQGADLSESDLSGAYLGEANLSQANLTGGVLTGANLNRADLRGAKVNELQLADANTYRTLTGFSVVREPAAESSQLSTQPIQQSPATPATQQAMRPGYIQIGDIKPAERTIALPQRQESNASEIGQSAQQANPQSDLQSDSQSANQSHPTERQSAANPWIAAAWAMAGVGSVASLVGISFLFAALPPGNLTASVSNTSAVLETDAVPADVLSVARALESEDQIWAVATSASELGTPLVAAGGEGGILQVWDRQTGDRIWTLSGHDSAVRDLAIIPSGQQLLSASDDGIKAWDLQTGELLYQVETEGEPVGSLAISPSERTFISSQYDGQITNRRIEDGAPVYSVEAESTVWSVEMAPDGQSFFSAQGDHTIYEWDLVTGQQIRSLTGHEDAVQTLSISADGKTLVSGSTDSTIKLWDLETSTLQATLSGHEDSVVSVALSPDGNTLASGSTDNTLKLWDISRQELATTVDKSGEVVALAFDTAATSPQTLVSGSKDRVVNVWQ